MPYRPLVTIRPSSIAGKGIFATQSIRRGIIRSVRFLPPALLNKYKPYLSSFILRVAQVKK